jgi:hypothetical protein
MLETDYLIIGSGAMGMAFADVLLTETDASMIIIDKHHKPGGHWNDAYPFVRLHQPSDFYGVSSHELSKGRKDQIGFNKGLNELASGAAVSAYFDEIMQHHFLPSGRVAYYPMCEYHGDNSFSSLLTGVHYEVNVKKKIVDCTYLKTSVPSTHKPNFSLSEGVHFMPLNELPGINNPPAGFVVIGGGKTGIDACLWLLENNVDPEKITWIVSRDSWLLSREKTQPTAEFFEATIGAQADQFEAIAQSSSVDNLFDRLEAAGIFVRIDQNQKPTMFHGATISQLELEAMRQIKNVVRMGHVQHIGYKEITLQDGKIPTSTKHVHIDCSARAISNLAIEPIFQGKLIKPQTVRAYQPVFSAALIAYVEVTYEADKKKNQLCQVVPLPNYATDWVKVMAINMVNQYTWTQEKALRTWINNDRLNGFSTLIRSASREDKAKMAILARLRNNLMPAMMKLQQYMTKT